MGGVISPLLANLYLHWFDKVFHRPDGPAWWAQAKLVRYADDFVVLARYQSPRLGTFIEEKLEAWMGLEINREKTRVVHLQEKGASLDFLGYTFRYQVYLRVSPRRYLSLHPSKHGLSGDQHVRSRAAQAPRAPSQPAASPTAGGDDLSRALQATGFGDFVRVERATACVCREGDSNGESRMPEIGTSGSTRGEQVARLSVSPVPLLYIKKTPRRPT